MRLPKSIILKLMRRAFDAGVKQGRGEGLFSEIETDVADEFVGGLLESYLRLTSTPPEETEVVW